MQAERERGREGKKGGDGILPRDLTWEAALSGNTDELAAAIPSIPHPCSTILAKETPCAMSKIQPGNLCHKVVTVSASKGTFKVDLQYSSKGEAGWTEVGNQADPKPAQVFIFEAGRTRGGGLAVPALPCAGQQSQAHCCAEEQQAGQDRNSDISIPTQAERQKALEAQAKSLNSVLSKIQQHSLNWRQKGFCRSL